MGVCKSKNELEDHAYYEKVWKSLDYGPPQPPPRPPQRSSSLSGESAPLSEPKVSSVYVDTLLVLLFWILESKASNEWKMIFFEKGFFKSEKWYFLGYSRFLKTKSTLFILRWFLVCNVLKLYCSESTSWQGQGKSDSAMTLLWCSDSIWAFKDYIVETGLNCKRSVGFKYVLFYFLHFPLRMTKGWNFCIFLLHNCDFATFC